MKPALGLIETRGGARGMVTIDALVKKAPVQIRTAHPISPGHFVIVFTGGVAEVEESLVAGVRCAGDLLLDQVFLPQIDLQVPDAMDGIYRAKHEDVDAIAILETHTVASTILATDAACKAADVQLMQMRLGQGLGGKAFFVMTGTLFDIEAAVEAGEEVIESSLLMTREVVARPHPDFVATYST